MDQFLVRPSKVHENHLFSVTFPSNSSEILSLAISKDNVCILWDTLPQKNFWKSENNPY